MIDARRALRKLCKPLRAFGASRAPAATKQAPTGSESRPMQDPEARFVAAASGQAGAISSEQLERQACAASAPTARSTLRRRPLPEITDRCTGCGRCIAACEPRVLWLAARGWEKSAALHDAGGCTGCSKCAAVCPFNAIRMYRPPPPGGGD